MLSVAIAYFCWGWSVNGLKSFKCARIAAIVYDFASGIFDDISDLVNYPEKKWKQKLEA